MAENMNAQELAELFIDRLGTIGLEWEVLWVRFQTLMNDYETTYTILERVNTLPIDDIVNILHDNIFMPGFLLLLLISVLRIIQFDTLYNEIPE